MKRIAIAGLLTLLAASPAWAEINLDGLTRIDSSTFDEVYVRPGGSPAGNFAAVQVDLAVGSEREESEIGSRDLERLRAKLEGELQSSANPDSPTSLTVTLTDLTPNRVLAERSSRHAGTHESFGVGGAAMEATYRDAASGNVLMVIIDERRGLPLTGNVHVQSRSVWGDADDIIEDWASELPTAP